MINIFSRMNKGLASWIAFYHFLRGLDRCGPNFTLGGEAKAAWEIDEARKALPRLAEHCANDANMIAKLQAIIA